MNESRPASGSPSQRDLVTAVPSWLSSLTLKMQSRRRALLAVTVVVALALVAATAALPFVLGLSQEDLEGLGYPGVFLANFLGTTTVFIPVPGLTAAGQALIVILAERLNPLAVALVASAGMTIAESTAYLAGYVGREVGERRSAPMQGRLGRWLGRTASVIDRLMERYGFLCLMALSAVPNPLFEFAGVTAGAVRMNFWRFLLAVGIGKTARALALAFVGQRLLDLFQRLLDLFPFT